MKRLRELLKRYNILKDIIFFGSFVKRKNEFTDIDVALIVLEKNKIIEKIKRDISRVVKNKLDFVVISFDDLYSDVLFNILKEGYSIKKNMFLNKNIKPIVLYKYSLRSLNNVDKVRFERGLNILLKEIKGIKLVRSVVMIPLNFSERFETFLSDWDIIYECDRFELIPEVFKGKG